MSESSDIQVREIEVFRIIVHASPPIDNGFMHWTEAPECPAAHEGGSTAKEAVERTKERIRAWQARRSGDSSAGEDIEFEVEEAL